MSHDSNMNEYWNGNAVDRIIHSLPVLNFCRCFRLEELRITIQILPWTFRSAAEIWVVDVSTMKQNASHFARVVEVFMDFQVDSLSYRQLGV